MRTLDLRNVPDDVVERLEMLAAREGISLSALAVRELTATARASRPFRPKQSTSSEAATSRSA